MPATPSEAPFPVLFCNLSRTWGGGEQWHASMAQTLVARGWPVQVLAWPGGALAQRVQALGLPLWELPLRSASLLNPLRMARVSQGLGRLAPGAVILNGAHELVSVGIPARLRGVPRIILRRGIPHALKPGAWNRLLLRRVATRLIANSHATLEAMERGFPDLVAGLRPRVIYNGVDPAGFVPPAARQPTGRVAVVGRLEWEKGIDQAIAALGWLRRQVPQARLRVVGGGSRLEALQAQARELGLAEAVEFTGPTRRVAELLRDVDALALPSRWEGFGFVLVEAMLMELPTVAFDLPAAREIIVPGVTGLLARAGDPQALAAALATLQEAPARAREMGLAGRLRALNNFTLERAAAELERLLLEPARAAPGLDAREGMP